MNTILINRKKLTSAEIDAYKDFQSLLRTQLNIPYKAPVRVFWKIFGISSVSIGIIIFLAWLLIIQPTNKIDLKTNQPMKICFVSPPLPNCDLPYKHIYYYNTSDTTISFSTNSKIEIKQNSLIDSSGNIARSPIEIRYREIMNPAEIFLSGIPMEYDSAGLKFTFESAGMIEIKAFYKNMPVFIIPEKPVEVYFESWTGGEDYNLYYLDTSIRNWIYKGKDKIKVQKKLPYIETSKDVSLLSKNPKNMSVITDSLSKTKLLITELKLRKPEPPSETNAKKWHISLDILRKEFPELKGFENTIFEIDENFNPLNLALSAIVWNDIKIEKADKAMHYYINFCNDTLNCQYLVYPVLSGKSYKEALKDYEMRFTSYQRELSIREKEEERLKQKLILEEAAWKRDSIIIVENYNTVETEQVVMRNFSMMNFGIWNCDKPIANLNSRVTNPVFMVNDTIYHKTVFLANKTRNFILTVVPGNDMHFDNRSKNFLWMVIGKNRIAVFRYENFKEITTNAESNIFHLVPIKADISSPEDFLKQYNSDFRDF